MKSKHRISIILAAFMLVLTAGLFFGVPTQPESNAQSSNHAANLSGASGETAVYQADSRFFGDFTSRENDFFYRSLVSIIRENTPTATGRGGHARSAPGNGRETRRPEMTKQAGNLQNPTQTDKKTGIFAILRKGPIDLPSDGVGQQRQTRPDVAQMVGPVSQDLDLRDLPIIPVTEQEDEEVRLTRYPPKPSSAGEPDKSDPFMPEQKSAVAPNMASPTQTFAGMTQNLGCGNCLPPDTDGDVGPNHYMQAVNSSLRIHDKAGNVLAGPITFNSFFSAMGTSNPCGNNQNGGDPIVFYDHMADRWVVSDFAFPAFPGTSFWQCIGVSKTSDPVAGGYWLYAVQVDAANPSFLGDYPKFGLWPDGYYLSVNMFSNPTTFNGVRMFALDRNQMVNGGPANTVAFTITPADIGAEYSLVPASWRTGLPPPVGQPEWFMSINSSAVGGTVENQVFVRRFHVDFVTPANSVFGVGASHAPDGIITVANFVDAFDNTFDTSIVPNGTATTTQFLDTLGDKLMYPLIYQNLGGVESAWVSHSVNNNQAGTGPVGVRWYQFNMTANTIPATPVQQQTFNNGADGLWRWMPSINVDWQGNMSIAYSASSTTVDPGIRYAGRLATDPLNTLTQGEAVMTPGTGHQTNASGRWGDYSSLFVDPADGCTFFHTNEYYSATSGAAWNTRVGSFKFPTCSPSPIPTPTPAVTPTPTPTPVPAGGGPVSVTATAGTVGPTDYATVKLAFDAINAGTHQGAINVFILGDTTETVAAVLNASGAGSAVYTSIIMVPSGVRTVTGNLATPLIDLNGADVVTIDGLNVGGNSLTFSNTNNSTTVGTSTIRFINGASNNVVKNCSILGSATVALGSAGGNLLFSTTSGVTVGSGNNNNLVTANNIGPAGANLPIKSISALGTVGNNTVNLNDVIDNNNIFDFFGTGAASVTAIDLRAGNNNWTISNNKIYQTAPRVFAGAALRYSGILFSGTTGANGNFHTISGNRIGFGAANGTGTTTISGLDNEFRGIDLQGANSSTTTSVQGNTISGINQTSSRNSTTTGLSVFAGIQASTLAGASATGIFDIGSITGNTIGSLDGSSTIVINATSVTANTTPVFGVIAFSGSSNNVSNNNMGAIAIQGAGTVTGFRGIFAGASAATTHTINNNLIGGPTAAGAITDTQVGSYAMYGIQTSAAAASISGNTIRNLSGNANGPALVIGGGIALVSTSTTNVCIVSRNTVHSLTNNSGTASNSIYAIDLTLPVSANVTGNLIERNFIHSNSITSTDNTSQIWGIVNRGAASATATATVQNNMIRLGIDSLGNAITGGFSIIGIRDIQGVGASAMSYYFNSVYIGGSGVASSSNTFAFNSGVVTTAHNFKDNIFFNARSNASGAGKNYAIAVGGTAPNPAGLSSDYNDLFATGTGGFTGLFNATDRTAISDWRTATGQDANSISADPIFIAPIGTATTVNLHIQPASPAVTAGTTISGITNDFDGDTRRPLPDIGADEIAPLADLSITKNDGVGSVTPGGPISYTIVASNAGTSPVNGAIVSDTISAAIVGPTWTCVGGGGGTCTASGAGNISDTVKLPVGGTVTYTVSGTISQNATGSLSNTATVSAPAGVTDPGGNNSATDVDTISKKATTTTVTSSANPSVFGQNVTFTATMGVVLPGTGTPTGTVQFVIDGSNFGSPVALVGGIAQTSTAALSVSGSPHTITANYSGDSSFDISSGTLLNGQIVNKASTTTALVSSVNPTVFGQSTTFTATLSVTGPGAGTPTGTVSFRDNGVNIGSCAAQAVAANVATCAISTLAVGSHPITAVYNGDSNFNASPPSNTVTQVVNKADTTTALVSSVNPTVFGQSTTFTATISITGPGSGTPTGTVSFRDNGVNIGSCAAQAVAANVATCAISTLAVGSHPITAVYNGDSNFNASPASNTVTQVVNKADTTTALVSSVNPTVFGQSTTFTATVSVTGPGAGTPTGTISFRDNGVNIGSCAAQAVAANVATSAISTLAVGSHPITAVYNGDGNFNASPASNTVTQVVNKANTATAVTSSVNPSAFGQNVSFTATVTAAAPGAGVPTGTVTFAIDGVNQPPAALSGGSVTMNTSTLSAGTHTITAQYNGDSNFNTSNGTLAGGQVVGKANTTTVITNAAALASTASNSGQAYAVNFTVTPVAPGAGTPTGFVSVSDGTDICLGTVAAGTCNLTSTTAGVKTITATYLGDPNFNSSSGTATHTVLASISGNIQQFVPPVANLAPEATTPLAGVTVSITGTAPLPASTTTDANGNYSFGGLTLGGNYTVTPTMAGKSFEPLSRSFTNVTANVTGADFVAYAPAVPREIKALNAYALQGQPAVMQLVLTGLGNEKTESFSLNFNINELSAPTVACGTSDAGCTIATDTSQPGKIGITVTPATQLAAGPRNIANVTFQTFASEPPNSPVTFGGAPTPQSTTDASNNPLQTTYTGAFAVFAKGFEGDVAPRPNGSGETDSSDIVGVSRFVAGLDNPVLLNTNEFQRADASPNGLKGDGKIDSTDIVQTTRYGAGLDGGTHVIVAGPMQALPLPPALTRAERSDEEREIARAKRTMRVGSVTAAPGSDVEVSVELDSRGDEVASSFTLNFDPARLKISGLSSPEANPDVAVGADAPAGTGLAVNATNAARGQIGIVVFNANLIPFSNATGRKVVTLHFRIAEDAPTGPSPITFGDTDDSPTQRSISDGNANPLKSTYTDGEVKIVGRNPAGSEISGRVVTTDGTGVMKAVVEITDSLGKSRQIVTGSFGVFHFGDVSAGETYSIRVSSKRYRFAPQTLAAGTDLADLTISGDPGL